MQIKKIIAEGREILSQVNLLLDEVIEILENNRLNDDTREDVLDILFEIKSRVDC